jgi:hypothetical protein
MHAYVSDDAMCNDHVKYTNTEGGTKVTEGGHNSQVNKMS